MPLLLSTSASVSSGRLTAHFLDPSIVKLNTFRVGILQGPAKLGTAAPLKFASNRLSHEPGAVLLTPVDGFE